LKTLLAIGAPLLGLVACRAPAREAGWRDPWNVLTPFWASDTMVNETLFLVSEEGRAASAPLLFEARRVLQLQTADGETRFTEGEDYVLGPDSRSIVALPGSRMPTTARADLYPPAGAEHAIGQRADGETWLLFGEGHFFHDRQVSVTYVHDDRWTGATPRFEREKLPRTIARLEARKSLTVSVSGDSISAGYNASLFTGAAPAQPAYPQLVVAALEEVYGSRVTLRNHAVSGWRSDEGVADAQDVAGDEPDLVLIAYGMNDRDPMSYSTNVRQIMETIRARSPEVEFLLVASMIGNPEWSAMDVGKFARFREALMSRAGPGVAVADVTSLWQQVLAWKRFHDLTGNGVNHPNDLGHRLYAQAILAALIEDHGKH
jgi:acyl-CoA thioesterase-1